MKWLLELTIFCSGTMVMVLEMVGARMLAPHVGTSAIVWTSLIGVVLAFLALGSWAGGKYADRRLASRGLGNILLGASLGCALTAFCNHGIGAGITGMVGNLYIAAICSAIGIFAFPAFFFGMATPYVIRLRLASMDTAGRTVGRLYALSTTGSILGTFLGGFILVSWFSSSSILWGVAGAMLVLSIANCRSRAAPKTALLALFAFLAWQDSVYASWQVKNGGPMIIETPYNSIKISEGVDYARNGAPVRFISTDPGYSQSGMLINDPDELYFSYTRYYALGPRFVPHAKSALMLGGGGYSVPKWLLAGKSGLGDAKDLKLDVVELDPGMTGVAAKLFSLPSDPRLSIFHEDARAFLNRLDRQYDLVFVDVFNSHYAIPFHMATQEAAKAMRKAVAPGGALVMNVISAVDGEDGRLFRAIWRALAAEFADVRVYCVGYPMQPDKVQNLMLVALPEKRALPEQLELPGMSPSRKEIELMEAHLHTPPVSDDTPAMRDDMAPVERYALMLTK